MQIEDFKTWQWALLGLIAGLAFSGVLALAGPSFATADLDTVDAATFEHALLGRTVRRGEAALVQRFHRDLPVIRDIAVHPPLRGDPNDWVTGQLYTVGPRLKDPKNPAGGMAYYEQWRPFKYPAPAPYLGQNGAVGKYPTVTAYLAAMKALKTTRFEYRYAWPEMPAALWSLPPLAGVLTIGLAWPLALGGMQSVGMARPPKLKAGPKAKPVALAPATAPNPRSAAALAAASTAGVRLAEPTPPPSPKPVRPADDKEYGGEFYPVVKKGLHD